MQTKMCFIALEFGNLALESFGNFFKKFVQTQI